MNKKRKIVLASLLKPVDDPRMYGKLALSMAQTTKYAINIIGFSSKKIPTHPEITFYPVFNFRRLSLQRLLAPLKYWQILLKVKPELIIVTTPDLLIVSCVHKILFGSRVIYDVQENYKQNIIWSSDLPTVIRLPFAYLTRLKEQLCKRMIIHFFLAETCYMNECSFIKEPFTFLENKARKPLGIDGIKKAKPAPFSPGKPLKFLYSGTIAESYGIFDCLQLVEKWVAEGFFLEFTIIGYCPRADTLRELLLRIKDKPYINLIGGNELIPHPNILQELIKTDFSFISYRLNPSNKGCIPTRIWECLAYQVPMIMKPDHPWIPLMQEFDAGLVVDFQNPGNQPFSTPLNYYQSKPIPSSFYWENEEIKLLKALQLAFRPA